MTEIPGVPGVIKNYTDSILNIEENTEPQPYDEPVEQQPDRPVAEMLAEKYGRDLDIIIDQTHSSEDTQRAKNIQDNTKALMEYLGHDNTYDLLMELLHVDYIETLTSTDANFAFIESILEAEYQRRICPN